MTRRRRTCGGFDGRDGIRAFLTERMLATPWRVRPLGGVNGQPGLACYQHDGSAFRLASVVVLSLRAGRICWIAGFIDPALLPHLPVPASLRVSESLPVPEGLPPDR